jgi:hypothetical protein
MSYTHALIAGTLVLQPIVVVKAKFEFEKFKLVMASADAFVFEIVIDCGVLTLNCETLLNESEVGDGVGSEATVTLTKPLITFADASVLLIAFEPTVHTPVVLLLFKS